MFSTNPAHDAAVRTTVAEAERLGLGNVYRPLTADEVRARFDSPVVRTGFRVTHAATVQPGRLARGLRNALLERGVRIFEGTPVERFNARRPAAETPSGTVRAGRAILGMNAWARALRDFRRSLVVRGTYIVISAPAPERLEAMHWTGGEGVYDMRTSLHYLRPTRDGRIAFGGLELPRHRATEPTRLATGYDAASASVLARDFRRWFPAFDGVPLEAAWGGPIDVAGLHTAVLRHVARWDHALRARLHRQRGRSLPSGGKILSGLALGIQDEATTLPISDGDRKDFPPEPLFTLGERVVSRAIIRRDDRLDAGRLPGKLTDLLAHLPRRLGYMLGP